MIGVDPSRERGRSEISQWWILSDKIPLLSHHILNNTITLLTCCLYTFNSMLINTFTTTYCKETQENREPETLMRRRKEQRFCWTSVKNLPWPEP